MNKPIYLLILLLFYFLFELKGQPAPVKVKIDPSQTYQTIEGFGACILDFKEFPDYYLDSAFLDLAIKDLGTSIIRFSVPQDMETFNDDEDPNHFNWPAINMLEMQKRMEFGQACKTRGVERFIASTWSPPEFTKTQRSLRYGGHLRMDQYDEYAENMAAFIISAKQNWDISIGAISLQNELLFIEPYKSCIYNPYHLKEAVRTISHKFEQEQINTMLLIPEDMMFTHRMINYILPTMDDPETRHFNGHFATHRHGGYEVVQEWKNQTAKYNRQSWMTETSGHKTDWQGALMMARDMYDYLAGGNFSAWVYWQLAEPNSVYALMDGPRTSPKFYAAKHYYKYIRPGALRIEATSDQENILVSAYKHPVDGTLTMVFINLAEKDAEVRLDFNGDNTPSGFKFYQSTQQQGFVQQPDLGLAKPTIIMPGKSMITLHGTNKGLKTKRSIDQWPESWAGPVKGKWGDFSKPAEAPGAHIGRMAEINLLEEVQKEINKGNIQAMNYNGWTALHHAILGGSYEAAELLLQAGADVNTPAQDGWTPFHMASATFVGNDHKNNTHSEKSKYDLFKLILAAQPDLNATTRDGWTPLHAAVSNSHTAYSQKEEEVTQRIQDLIDAGADLEAKDTRGRTPLHWAAWQGYQQMMTVKDDVIKLLLEAGAELDVRDSKGRTPLHYAADLGYIPIVSALVKAGGDPEQKDNQGETPLQIAQRKDLSVVTYVLKFHELPSGYQVGASQTNKGDGRLGNELLKAAWQGEIQKVKQMLEQGADIYYVDTDGFRAIDRARDNGFDEIVKLLKAAEKE
ncbi:MAG: ankyrin repeat domain-containing protein [Candidatus Cyclobacteriaceae bacterium M3_2C_046]